MLKFANTRIQFAYVTPLALVGLSACGGGNNGGGGGGAAVNGNVVKGPLSNALVFLDLNDNNTLDAGEQSIRTNADGSFSITTTATDYKIVAITDDSTIDTSSGTVLSGVTLSAPKDAGVVTPTTTLMEEGGMTADQVAAVLGLPDGVDPLTFNPYADGVDAATALAVEKVSQQIITAVSSFAAAAEGAGADGADAFEAALKSVADVVKTKSDGSGTLDFTDAADLNLIKANVSTEAAKLAGVDANAVDALVDSTATSIKNVAETIATANDLSSDASKNIFSSTTVLKNQVKAAAEAEAATPGSGAASITFTDKNAVTTSANNAAPTALELSIYADQINEGLPATFMGTLTTTDSDNETGHTYKLAEIEGEDYADFNIDADTGALFFKTIPDAEVKSDFVLTVITTDPGGKQFSKTFNIAVLENPYEAKVKVKITLDNASEGAGAEYQTALTTFTTEYTAFVAKVSTFFQDVDVNMDAASAQQQAPVLRSIEDNAYSFSFGSYIFDIYDSSPPTIVDPSNPTEQEMASLLDVSSWTVDNGMYRVGILEDGVGAPREFSIEVSTGSDPAPDTLKLIDLRPTESGTDIDKVTFTGDFSNFSFDDFEGLMHALSIEYSDEHAENGMPAEGEMGEMPGPSEVTNIAIFKGNGYTQGLTPVAELTSSKSTGSLNYDSLSLTLGEFTLDIVEEGENLDMISAADFFDLANTDILADVDDLLTEGIKATATFSHNNYGTLIELDSTALTDGVAGPQIADDFDFGTITFLNGTSDEANKFVTDTNDAVGFVVNFGMMNEMVTDAEFEAYWNGVEDIEDLFADFTNLIA